MLGIYIVPLLLKMVDAFDSIIFSLGWRTPALELFSNSHRTPILLVVFFPVFLWDSSTWRKSGFDAPEGEYYLLENLDKKQVWKKALFLF